MATRTRSSTDHWLLGQGKASLPPSQLPSGEDVLREMLWKTESDESDIESSIACQSTKGTFELKCNESGCLLKDDHTMKCTVRKILEIYKRAAIPTAREDKIKERCLKLYKNWKQLKGERNVKTSSAIKKRDKFLEDLKPAFMAYHAQAEDLINSDPQRSDETKKEDIEFLRDQKSKREAKIDSTADKVYTQKVILDGQQEERKRKRESDMENRREKEKKAREERFSTVNLEVELMTIMESNNNKDMGGAGRWAGGPGGPGEALEGERGAGGAGGPVEASGEAKERGGSPGPGVCGSKLSRSSKEEEEDQEEMWTNCSHSSQHLRAVCS